MNESTFDAVLQRMLASLLLIHVMSIIVIIGGGRYFIFGVGTIHQKMGRGKALETRLGRGIKASHQNLLKLLNQEIFYAHYTFE